MSSNLKRISFDCLHRFQLLGDTDDLGLSQQPSVAPNLPTLPLRHNENGDQLTSFPIMTITKNRVQNRQNQQKQFTLTRKDFDKLVNFQLDDPEAFLGGIQSELLPDLFEEELSSVQTTFHSMS